MRKLIIGSLGVFLLASCSPSITTQIIRQQEVTNRKQQVTVFNNKEQLPENYTILGTINAGDAGFAVDCDSSKMIGEIIYESRKAGGNAVLITEHKRPSFWGSSCHRFKGIILNITDDAGQEGENSGELEKIALSLKKQRLLPRFNFSAGLGPSWRTDEIANGLDEFQHNFYKELHSGFQWNISADYFFSDICGIRLSYQQFFSNHSERVSNGYITGNLEGSDYINTFLPSFVVRVSTPERKWLFDFSVGIGYIGLTERFDFPDRTFSQMTGSSVAFRSTLGVEYRFIENLGICFDLFATSGSLNRVEINENGVTRTVNFDKNYREGLNHISAQLGLKFHLTHFAANPT